VSLDPWTTKTATAVLMFCYPASKYYSCIHTLDARITTQLTNNRVRMILALGIAQYFPVLGSIGYWAILLLAVIPNTNTAWTP